MTALALNPRFAAPRPLISEFAKDLLVGIMWAVTHGTTTRNAIGDAVVDRLDAGAGAGTLEFQTSGAVEVGTPTFSDPAFGNTAAGVATANAITDDSNVTGGTIGQWVAQDSDSNAVFQGSAGLTGSGEDVELTAVALNAGDGLGVSSFQYTAAP